MTHIARARRPTSSSTRSRISCAALLVKVIARISPGAACPVPTRCAIRWVSTRVLPEPAPGQDQQRALAVQDGLALGLVEALEEGVGGDGCAHPSRIGSATGRRRCGTAAGCRSRSPCCRPDRSRRPRRRSRSRRCRRRHCRRSGSRRHGRRCRRRRSRARCCCAERAGREGADEDAVGRGARHLVLDDRVARAGQQHDAGLRPRALREVAPSRRCRFRRPGCRTRTRRRARGRSECGCAPGARRRRRP